MIETPLANRKNIVIVGDINSGKSTLFNKIINQEKSIVSNHRGTTTDPVYKAMEIVDFGPVKITDTAGINDEGEVGSLRVKKSEEEIKEADLVIHVFSVEDFYDGNFDKIVFLKDKYELLFKKYIFVINKCDKVENIDDLKGKIQKSFKDTFFISMVDDENRRFKKDFESFVENISKKLSELEEDRGLLDGLVKSGDTVVLVVPIDSEAPKKRLILPQVQVIRECLDMGVKTMIVKETELEEALNILKDVDLVITDSKIFGIVDSIIPKDIRLTSFSIVFTRQKGDIDEFLNGTAMVKYLKDGDRVLVAESCTHTKSHEDIGTVLIPRLLRKKTGKNIEFDFSHGKLKTEDLSQYSLVIQCGGCMMTRRNMLNRMELAKTQGVPITNYGVILAYLNGIFERVVY